MTSSADLHRRLKYQQIKVDGSGPLGGWEDAHIKPGHTSECHPDFIATPIGDSPYGFIVCQRKKDLQDGNPLEGASRMKGKKYGIHATPHQPHQRYRPILSDQGYVVSQSHNLIDERPGAHNYRNDLGGQPLHMPDRRPPHQAHLQGVDYYRDPIRYRGVGIEKISTVPGQFIHEENKYYHSAPPSRYDITHFAQPYDLWKREQLRNNHFTNEQMGHIDAKHTFYATSSTF